MLHPLVKNGSDMVVGQRIKYGLAVPAVFHQLTLFEHLQLVRDLETREALTTALAQFEGTLVLVSHDRHLLRATTDQFIIVADGRFSPFDGDLDDYKDWLYKTKLSAKAAA